MQLVPLYSLLVLLSGALEAGAQPPLENWRSANSLYDGTLRLRAGVEPVPTDQNFPIPRHSRESGNPGLDARLRGHDEKSPAIGEMIQAYDQLKRTHKLAQGLPLTQETSQRLADAFLLLAPRLASWECSIYPEWMIQICLENAKIHAAASGKDYAAKIQDTKRKIVQKKPR